MHNTDFIIIVTTAMLAHTLFIASIISFSDNYY